MSLAKPSFRIWIQARGDKLTENLRDARALGRPLRREADYGSANTKIEFVAWGIRASGIVSVTMLLDQDPPPVPTGTAMYCLPLTAYVIGNP